MARLAVWLVKNADGAIALLVAVVVAVIGLTDDPDPQLVSGATLLVLGLVSAGILRDRYRRGPVEEEVRDSLRTLAVLPERLERIEEFEQLVRRSRLALDESSAVQVLGGAEVAPALAAARAGTDRWTFKGGTGTYIRAVTLPGLVAAARRDGRTLLVRLEIIDPSDGDVCDTYARFRRAGADSTAQAEPWTLERTRKESYATILAVCWYTERFRLLEVVIGLSRTMTTFRWDLSASSVIITREEPTGPALKIDKGKFYYDWCAAELLNSLDQARRVPLEQARAAPLSDEPTIEEVRRLFQALGLALPRSFTDRDVMDIARRALRAANPYPDGPDPDPDGHELTRRDR
ncbi:hypothetical protein [Actinocorallia sp. A-T 12471]|uniref:hypothetical protein n=1 Tax=Actinocorallia sp. A-T 12471 TaxID=3089813 RepID=UPI0029CC57BF|nr:hypothetical protein [Actinocorallia sp. A-T 12471]MDX6742990.1 hypothetical protein [Actinocorallia sp. A-T 12471]